MWYVLPAIRKELVIALKNQGKSQKETALLLNLTESAVSQYLNEKRAKEVFLPKEIKEFIAEAAMKVKDKESAYQQIQKISAYVKRTKAICKIHMGVEKGLERCQICFE